MHPEVILKNAPGPEYFANLKILNIINGIEEAGLQDLRWLKNLEIYS